MAKQKTILIVDDEKEIRDFLGDYLKSRNFKVQYAINGISAFDMILNNSINYLITDNNMPGKTGIELIENIIEEGFRFERIVLCSAFPVTQNSAEQLQRLLASLKALGPLFYIIEKPFDVMYLDSVLNGTYSPRVPSKIFYS